MLPNSARQKSLYVYHLQMGGADADALEWRSLEAPRFQVRLQYIGVRFIGSAADADIVVVTGLLTARNLDSVLEQLAAMPSPSALVTAGDAATNGGIWASAELLGLAPYPLSHYADVSLSVLGSPPTPQALLAVLSAAARFVTQPNEQPAAWRDEEGG